MNPGKSLGADKTVAFPKNLSSPFTPALHVNLIFLRGRVKIMGYGFEIGLKIGIPRTTLRSYIIVRLYLEYALT